MKKGTVLLFGMIAALSACGIPTAPAEGPSSALGTASPRLTPALSPPAPEPTSEPYVRPPVTDPDRPIRAAVGEEFRIVIDSNPSTGYHWEIPGELDERVLEFVSREYVRDEPVKPGSGGVDVWVFEAVSAGEAQITLGSYPPSLDPVDPEQIVTFVIQIE